MKLKDTTGQTGLETDAQVDVQSESRTDSWSDERWTESWVARQEKTMYMRPPVAWAETDGRLRWMELSLLTPTPCDCHCLRRHRGSRNIWEEFSGVDVVFLSWAGSRYTLSSAQVVHWVWRMRPTSVDWHWSVCQLVSGCKEGTQNLHFFCWIPYLILTNVLFWKSTTTSLYDYLLMHVKTFSFASVLRSSCTSLRGLVRPVTCPNISAKWKPKGQKNDQKASEEAEEESATASFTRQYLSE